MVCYFCESNSLLNANKRSIMEKIVKKFEKSKYRFYVTSKNVPECNYQLHNLKDYEVLEYDDQPFGVGLVTILLPNGSEKTFRKTMFSEPFKK